MNYSISSKKIERTVSMDKGNKELIWGEIKVQDLLKKLYKGKSLDNMTEQEVDKMLEDLI